MDHCSQGWTHPYQVVICQAYLKGWDTLQAQFAFGAWHARHLSEGLTCLWQEWVGCHQHTHHYGHQAKMSLWQECHCGQPPSCCCRQLGACNAWREPGASWWPDHLPSPHWLPSQSLPPMEQPGSWWPASSYFAWARRQPVTWRRAAWNPSARGWLCGTAPSRCYASCGCAGMRRQCEEWWLPS